MNSFDQKPLNQPEQNPAEQTTETPGDMPSAEPAPQMVSEIPISYASPAPAESFDARLPEDLRISWSWAHLLIFAGFFLSAQFAIGAVVVGYYSIYRHLSQEQLKALVESNPQLLLGTSILMFALIFLFLYITLAALRGVPFWRTLGWKKLQSDAEGGKGKPWMFFLSGCGLWLFVALASARVKDAEHAPIQEFFKSRSGAMMLMAMAILVAPLAEETIFRGYLYPVLARITSGVLQFYGMEFSVATRAGVATSILLTGLLFGLMHAPQLGWTLGLVSLLILVGVIFTFVRAWTGTVFASFLLHLGYNSMIAVTSIIATKGFTQMPPHP